MPQTIHDTANLFVNETQRKEKEKGQKGKRLKGEEEEEQARLASLLFFLFPSSPFNLLSLDFNCGAGGRASGDRCGGCRG